MSEDVRLKTIDEILRMLDEHLHVWKQEFLNHDLAFGPATNDGAFAVTRCMEDLRQMKDPERYDPKRVRRTWRVGKKLGRTIYIDDACMGMVDTPELAVEIVRAMNAFE